MFGGRGTLDVGSQNRQTRVRHHFWRVAAFFSSFSDKYFVHSDRTGSSRVLVLRQVRQTLRMLRMLVITDFLGGVLISQRERERERER